MKYWLIKSDPKSYSWENMKSDKTTDWDGVRNYQARNNLKLMKKGDTLLFYHSVDDKQVMGVVTVTNEFYQDPTTEDERWVAVKVKAGKTLKNPVSLADIKARKGLSEIALIKQSRLSVMPLRKKEYDTIIKMSEK